MKKKSIITVVSAVVVALTIFLVFSNLRTNEIEFNANVAYTVEYNEIAEYADLIILATPLLDVEERKSEITYLDDIHINQFRSFNELKIDKILKDTSASYKTGSSVHVVEPIAFREEDKTLLKQEGYEALQKGENYVIFLKKFPDADYYSIIRDSDGVETINTKNDIDEQIATIIKKHSIR